MGFEGLLGNPRLKENLSGSLDRGKIAHFYLISGPLGSGKHTLARLLAAGILCTAGKGKPCGVCPDCRKVFAGLHPDFITMDDPEKKTVSVDLVRQARSELYVQPNEGSHKIYLFPRAQDMGIPGQNALLKVLEEPPKYGVFLLLTDNPEKMLPTVRSRCTELRMLPLEKESILSNLKQEYPEAEEKQLLSAAARSGGYLGQAKSLMEQGEESSQELMAFAKVFVSRNPLERMELLVPMEKQKRETLIATLENWISLLEGALCYRSGGTTTLRLSARIAERIPSAEILKTISRLQRCVEYAKGNVSPGAICGYLEWALRD